MTDQPVDYGSMSGAEFRRAVGADPAKWAAALAQRANPDGQSHDLGYMTQWFADAMAAAVAADRRDRPA